MLSFFILDENQYVHQIEKSQSYDRYESVKTFDYRGHKLDELLADGWNQCQISNRSIVYNKIVF